MSVEKTDANMFRDGHSNQVKGSSGRNFKPTSSACWQLDGRTHLTPSDLSLLISFFKSFFGHLAAFKWNFYVATNENAH